MSDGYTHDPDAFDEDDEYTPETSTGSDGDGNERDPMTVHPDDVDREFDKRGWTLVAAIFVAFIVIPGIIFAYPYLGPQLGLSFWDTYLALPMVPAIVLGILAVWATTRP
ncbi:hypothetical protein KY092_14935 [Natronomonas gomsonensis]|jgi:hypothetical protein|uniref:hypothetical protein n=1 Tax=Natronomonas gomsonensis TaxID=1046043 RepID=UPI0020CA7FC5|nr:hypothetical protein [Natronomonas gomsonensis]MCY4731853.1 hypothetical protein [Natronomonas gomsonensis]